MYHSMETSIRQVYIFTIPLKNLLTFFIFNEEMQLSPQILRFIGQTRLCLDENFKQKILKMDSRPDSPILPIQTLLKAKIFSSSHLSLVSCLKILPLPTHALLLDKPHKSNTHKNTEIYVVLQNCLHPHSMHHTIPL